MGDEVNKRNRAENRDPVAPLDAAQCIPEMLTKLRREAARNWRPGFLKGESASDLFQRTVAIALKEADDFRGSSKAELYSWLKTILINEIRQSLRKYRQKKRDVRLEEPFVQAVHLVASHETPSWIVADLERKDRLEICLGKLSPEQRKVLELRINEKLSHEEVGARIGKTAEAARKISQRAAAKLHRLIESEIA